MLEFGLGFLVGMVSASLLMAVALAICAVGARYDDEMEYDKRQAKGPEGREYE